MKAMATWEGEPPTNRLWRHFFGDILGLLKPMEECNKDTIDIMQTVDVIVI